MWGESLRFISSKDLNGEIGGCEIRCSSIQILSERKEKNGKRETRRCGLSAAKSSLYLK